MEHPSAVESDPLAQMLEGAGEALRRLFDEADEPRLLLTTDRVVVLVNQAAERMLGRDRSQVIGQPARMLAPARLSEDYWRVYETHARTHLMQGPSRCNLWALRADGSEFPVRIAARVVRLRSGATYFSLMVVDRSDAAGGPSGPLRNFLDAVGVGSVIADADGRIVMVNSRALAKFGYGGERVDRAARRDPHAQPAARPSRRRPAAVHRERAHPRDGPGSSRRGVPQGRYDVPGQRHALVTGHENEVLIAASCGTSPTSSLCGESRRCSRTSSWQRSLTSCGRH